MMKIEDIEALIKLFKKEHIKNFKITSDGFEGSFSDQAFSAGKTIPKKETTPAITDKELLHWSSNPRND